MRASARVRTVTALHYFVRVLIVLTIALPIWHHFGMNSELELSSQNGHYFRVTDDTSSGGSSKGKLLQKDGATTIDCELVKASYEWPFCTMTITLRPNRNKLIKHGKKADLSGDSVDLSVYDTVSFDLTYTGQGSNSVRFYLRNFEEGISILDDWHSYKVNEIEFEVPPSGEVTIPLSLFHIAPWWASNRKVPVERTGTRFDRVHYVELSTGSLVKEGHHQIEMRSIKFHGKWISQAHLLMLLVGAWFIFGVGRVLVELWGSKANLRATKLRLAHMVTVLRAKREQAQVQASAQETRQPIGDDSPAPTDPLQPVPPSAETSPSRQNYLRWISATVGNSMRMIMVDEIVYFQADQKYTRVVTANSEVLIRTTLKDLLQELDPDQFWKLHRSIVVNVLEIASIDPNFKGELVVKLKSLPDQLPVSDVFMRWYRKKTDAQKL